jgi:para-aminobenzoate synthetase/4-amino-4-deoxychorismate lyase
MRAIPSNSVLIQEPSSDAPTWRLFEDPIAVIQTDSVERVPECLDAVQTHTARGCYAAGFVSYDAAPAMDSAFKAHRSSDFPLVWFGIYRDYRRVALPSPTADAFKLGPWTSSVSSDEYRDAVAKIKNHIGDGNAYQVNYTFRLRSSFSGDPWEFFLALQRSQQSQYAAYLDLGRYRVCSASPELFFSLDGGTLTSKPMKGTVRRGATAEEDERLGRWLGASSKNRAENVMVVDMVRNDMGGVADTGTISVEKLFSVEKYPTVFQMTSTVTARVSSPAVDVLRRMFPCASITGAPKVKVMEIIQSLEKEPRGLYTGSIGYLAPDGTASFNVAIRTAVFDTATGSAEYGVGGGIVWDSDADEEYEECNAKAAVLARAASVF